MATEKHATLPETYKGPGKLVAFIGGGAVGTAIATIPATVLGALSIKNFLKPAKAAFEDFDFGENLKEAAENLAQSGKETLSKGGNKGKWLGIAAVATFIGGGILGAVMSVHKVTKERKQLAQSQADLNTTQSELGNTQVALMASQQQTGLLAHTIDHERTQNKRFTDAIISRHAEAPPHALHQTPHANPMAALEEALAKHAHAAQTHTAQVQPKGEHASHAEALEARDAATSQETGRAA